jgi:cysteine-rich repeat protein
VVPGFYCPIVDYESKCYTICGDYIVAGREECDEGFYNNNNNSLSGCSSNCTISHGFYCNTTVNLSSICWTNCGDGIIAGY